MAWCHVPGIDCPSAQAAEAWIWASCLPSPVSTRALRLLGNGVHPLAAAHAWRALSTAHGLGPLDLATNGQAGGPSADETV
jgi:hypothetical protein